MFQIALHNYTGPLDLLLSLIEEKKMPIHEVSLAAVTDSFLSYISKLSSQKQNIPLITYYLVVAATLVLIKSRSLLPQVVLTEDEQKSIKDLELQLALLKIFKEGGKVLTTAWGRSVLYERSKKVAIPVFAPDPVLTPDFLKQQFLHVLHEVPKPEVLPKQVMREVVHLHDIMDSITEKMETGTSFTFFDFTKQLFERFKDRLTDASKKSAMVVTFLALLEMMREGKVHAEQDGEDIVVAPQKESRV